MTPVNTVSLRDEFAIRILGQLLGATHGGYSPSLLIDHEKVAEEAYQIAEVMLKESGKWLLMENRIPEPSCT